MSHVQYVPQSNRWEQTLQLEVSERRRSTWPSAPMNLLFLLTWPLSLWRARRWFPTAVRSPAGCSAAVASGVGSISGTQPKRTNAWRLNSRNTYCTVHMLKSIQMSTWSLTCCCWRYRSSSVGAVGVCQTEQVVNHRSGIWSLGCDLSVMMPDNVSTLTLVLWDSPPGWKCDKTSGWQGERLSVLTPRVLRLIGELCL